MGDRFDGTLASGSHFPVGDLSVSTALQSLSIHETLVTTSNSVEVEQWPEDATGNGNDHQDGSTPSENNLILFKAVQDASHGGVMYTTEACTALRDAIKQSQMTSMLKDDARCEKYAQALRRVVQKGDVVLDIGAGTGLLSVLAARAGALRVEAIEMFGPLACVARNIAKDNGYERCITVHATHSTALEWSPEQRAHVLVSEIFDSALLGEGCLTAMRHARENLLTPNARMVPAKASVYGRVVSSEFLNKFYNLGDDFSLHRSENNGPKCCGGVVPVPIHLNALQQGQDYQPISNKFKVFDFDFSVDVTVPRQQTIVVPRTASGVAQAVVWWWDLDLVGDGSITFSTEPGVENWQDHWLQMAHPLPACTQAMSDNSKTITLQAIQDDVSIRFSLGIGPNGDDTAACSCGWHALIGGPYRIHELASPNRLSHISKRISDVLHTAVSQRQEHSSMGVKQKVRCIDVSDGAVCSLLAAQCVDDLDVEVEILSADDDELSAFIHSQVGYHLKKTRNSNVTIDSEFEPVHAVVQRELTTKQTDQDNWRPFDVILSEPYTRAMYQYPLATLSNLLILHRLLTNAQMIQTPGALFVPGRARILSQMVKFVDPVVQKAFGKVGSVQGVDHSAYDELWSGEGAQDLFNSTREQNDMEATKLRRRISLPLFQYPTTAVSSITSLHEIDFSEVQGAVLEQKHYASLHTGATHEDMSVPGLPSSDMRADAIAFWVMYDELKESRVQRYELLILDDAERAKVEQSGVLNLYIHWDAQTALWDINTKLQ